MAGPFSVPYTDPASTGKGSDIMVPIAIPSFGGTTLVLISVFLVPTLYSALAERSVEST